MMNFRQVLATSQKNNSSNLKDTAYLEKISQTTPPTLAHYAKKIQSDLENFTCLASRTLKKMCGPSSDSYLHNIQRQKLVIFLREDKILWKDFCTKLSEEMVVTNVAVAEVLNNYLDENEKIITNRYVKRVTEEIEKEISCSPKMPKRRKEVTAHYAGDELEPTQFERCSVPDSFCWATQKTANKKNVAQVDTYKLRNGTTSPLFNVAWIKGIVQKDDKSKSKLKNTKSKSIPAYPILNKVNKSETQNKCNSERYVKWVMSFLMRSKSSTTQVEEKRHSELPFQDHIDNPNTLMANKNYYKDCVSDECIRESESFQLTSDVYSGDELIESWCDHGLRAGDTKYDAHGSISK